MKKEHELYKQLRKPNSLRKAWHKVRSNGLKSKSVDTREQIKEFDALSDKYLAIIARQLREGRFKFGASLGVAADKGNNKGHRPIVIAPIASRVVQRAILDALQSYQPLAPYFEVETSFGGIKKRSVEGAVSKVYECITSGNAKHFVRSDIKSFFTKIPKDRIFEVIDREVGDSFFLDFFKNAVTTELSNMADLGSSRDLFPLHEIGVAQGSCLSPLIGNIVLSEFDRLLNTDDIACIRYIDDFIILAPNKNDLVRCFTKAQKILAGLGMEAYKPDAGPEKCAIGPTANTIPFLGCEIRKGMIRPGKKSCDRLIATLERQIEISQGLMPTPDRLVKRRMTFIETLENCGNVLRGWGSQYSFCNDYGLTKKLDEKVDSIIRNYISYYSNIARKLEAQDTNHRRRLLGVSLLADCKNEPIVPNS